MVTDMIISYLVIKCLSQIWFAEMDTVDVGKEMSVPKLDYFRGIFQDVVAKTLTGTFRNLSENGKVV